VAQRTGDKRLLRPPAKGASAGAISLALALAALLLGGCGSGSSDPSTEGTAQGTASSSPPAEQASAPGQGKAGAGAKQGEGGSSSDPAHSAPQGAGQKHGPRIAQPTGKREQPPSPAEIAKATVADMSLEAPTLPLTSEGPARLSPPYTCDGKDSWPELRWSGVPAGSAELILYVMNVAPVQGRLFVDWAVAGLQPSLTGIEAGKLPRGAIIGTNSFGKRGYEICPPPGSGETYIFAVYALPRALSPRRGFDARELRQQVLDVSGDVGLLSASYTRG
jgi:phosphatidylethanolamine-binding protein (PEBP) family uncharacterized protein